MTDKKPNEDTILINKLVFYKGSGISGICDACKCHRKLYYRGKVAQASQYAIYVYACSEQCMGILHNAPTYILQHIEHIMRALGYSWSAKAFIKEMERQSKNN